MVGIDSPAQWIGLARMVFHWKIWRMQRTLLVVVTLCSVPAWTLADEVIRSANERFAAATDESPDFRRHVLPLLGRLGCNGRACHGSFQGQGGFRLSLFGYDFDADHEALVSGDQPRVNLLQPLDSLILQKPTLKIDHEGGERMKADSWQYRLLARWIEMGAKPVSEGAPQFSHLEVSPAEIVFKQAGETASLKVTAFWSDGTREDVTPICRFRTNDESIARIDDAGLVTAVGRGDTHVVTFYDNGVLPVGVALPVTDLVADRYPKVSTPTKIDELVVAKLSQLGIVPSELCSDAEFLRRASLDITGTLPTPGQVQAFVSDAAPDKRQKKIDELLARPAYVAWWTTRLCDFTGANPKVLNEGPFDGSRTAAQWYAWIYKRVEENTPYDQLVAGLVLAAGRSSGQSYDDYCRQMSEYYGDEEGASFAERDSMPHYWMRRNARKPEDRAQAFAYAFLGVRLQCAQCHKHPFDQWTKHDFDQFSQFFGRVGFGVAPDARKRSQQLQAELTPKRGKKKVDLRKDLPKLLAAGKVVPWPEVFIAPQQARAKLPKNQKNKKQAPRPSAPAMLATLLNGEAVDLAEYADPRQALMDWLRKDADRYFARAFVNRVWAAYFNVGIVEPPDDLNLANPPSNRALLDYLTGEFIERGYDMRWLHREITSSRTYQLSCRPNDTNGLDLRNFSRAVPRRLPAEVAYNALIEATARTADLEKLQATPDQLAIGSGFGAERKLAQQASYALNVFGKPERTVNCDCERSAEPTLLQTLYLRNDQDMLGLVERGDGWLAELADHARTREALGTAAALAARRLTRQDDLAHAQEGLRQGQASGDNAKIKRSRQRVSEIEKELKSLGDQYGKVESKIKAAPPDAPADDELVRQAYLRSLSRAPTEEELATSLNWLRDPQNKRTGMRDLVWALLNTKEFILNH